MLNVKEHSQFFALILFTLFDPLRSLFMLYMRHQLIIVLNSLPCLLSFSFLPQTLIFFFSSPLTLIKECLVDIDHISYEKLSTKVLK